MAARKRGKLPGRPKADEEKIPYALISYRTGDKSNGYYGEGWYLSYDSVSKDTEG